METAALIALAIFGGMMAQDPPKQENRLAKEKSPYLRQHKNNPVDWFPWGDEALKKAKDEDKPIFLSIGYSTCHWCHVMEHESFENEAIAKALNEKFVSIKVDREERPDLDEIYMQAVQAFTGGHGGWPMSLFLTPELKPFYGGTYFPPEGKFGRPGFDEILDLVAGQWKDNRKKLLESADEVTKALAEASKATGDKEPGPGVFKRLAEIADRSFDSAHSGFGGAPKFPPTMKMEALLRLDEAGLTKMVETTLDKMAAGGIHDHVAGGFHRYSVDAHWLVPHFEKMLYDQALLAKIYLLASRKTGQKRHADVARRTLDYVLAQMTSPDGGFYSAEDADSEGGEGAFYVWSPEEVERVLGKEEGRRFCRAFDVTEDGNFEELHKSILNRVADDAFDAAVFEKLLAARAKRPRPLRDEKVLTEWNGLMISSMAIAGEEKYVKAGARAADFVLKHLRKDGKLLRRFMEGEARFDATLADYGALASGLIDLHQATQEPRWLEEAAALVSTMNELFWDKEGGGYFSAAASPDLLVRTKEFYDGATPGGNSLAMHALVRLEALTGETAHREKASKLAKLAAKGLEGAPHAYAYFLAAYQLYTGVTTVVVAGDDPAAMTAEARAGYRPAVLVVAVTAANRAALEKLAPGLKDKLPVDGKTAAYVCTNFTCKLPVTTVEALRKQLAK